MKLSSPLTRYAISFSALAIAVAPAMATHNHHSRVHKSAHWHVRKDKPAADPAIRPIVGVWYVNSNGKESHAQKLVFHPNGTFLFIGSGWKSEGKFTVKDATLTLLWTAVDGSPVKFGSMHKALALNAAQNSFVIDRYTYDKHVE